MVTSFKRLQRNFPWSIASLCVITVLSSTVNSYGMVDAALKGLQAERVTAKAGRVPVATSASVPSAWLAKISAQANKTALASDTPVVTPVTPATSAPIAAPAVTPAVPATSAPVPAPAPQRVEVEIKVTPTAPAANVTAPAASATPATAPDGKTAPETPAASATPAGPATSAKPVVAPEKATGLWAALWTNRTWGQIGVGAAATAGTGYLVYKNWDEIKGHVEDHKGKYATGAAVAGAGLGAYKFFPEAVSAVSTDVHAKLDQMMEKDTGRYITYGLGAAAAAGLAYWAYKKADCYLDHWKFYNLLVDKTIAVNPRRPQAKFRWSGSYSQTNNAINIADLVRVAAGNKSGLRVAMIQAVTDGTAHVIDYDHNSVVSKAYFKHYKLNQQLTVIRKALIMEKTELANFLNRWGNRTLQAEFFCRFNLSLGDESGNIDSIDLLKNHAASLDAYVASTAEEYAKKSGFLDIDTHEYRTYVYAEAARAYARACVLLDVVSDGVVSSSTATSGTYAGPRVGMSHEEQLAACEKRRSVAARELAGMAEAAKSGLNPEQAARQLLLLSELQDVQALEDRLRAASATQS